MHIDEKDQQQKRVTYVTISSWKMSLFLIFCKFKQIIKFLTEISHGMHQFRK